MKIIDKKFLHYRLRDFTLLILGCLLSLNASAAELANIEFSRDSQNLVLSFTESHGVMVGQDAGTTVKIYGNGLVKVHYPVYMKKAGDYEMMLDDDALNELLQTLAKKSIPELNINEAQSEKKTSMARKSVSGQRQLFAVYDASVTTIELNLDRYTKQSDSLVTTGNVNDGSLTESAHDIVDLKQKISWEGLRLDAEQFPNIEAIQNLASAQKMLLEIADSKKLIRSEQQ